MSKLFSIDVSESLAVRLSELTKSIDGNLRKALDQAILDLASAAYAKALELAKEKLDSTFDTYRDALKFEIVSPGVYSVSLGEEAKHLEDGYESFNMRAGLLKNAKKVSRQGYRYRSIPFKHGKGQSGSSSGNMLDDLNRLRGGFGDKGITKGDDGKPLLGKIFSINRNDTGMWSLNPAQPGVAAANQRFGEPEPSKNLVGLTKYQYGTKTRSGKDLIRSAYITYRTVSENPATFMKDGKPTWQHPGFSGIHTFEQLIPWVEAQLDKILDSILGHR